MGSWKTFFLWLLISLAVSVLLMLIFRTPIVLGVMILPIGFLFSRSRARQKDVPPAEQDRNGPIEPR